MALSVLKVSQLNRYIRSKLESDTLLTEIYLKGEVTNLAVYPSGHLYFSLKDESAAVRAVMFAQHAAFLRKLPENGMNVMARGSVSLYERDGQFQIRVVDLVQQGAGEDALEIEMLRRRLSEEGLFSAERKRELPHHPRVIGVVTSPQGAVIHDIVSVLERKAPYIKILLSPAVVQGAEAESSVVRAINALNEDGRSDVIIIARGGGSAEDLRVFQKESVVRAAASSSIPTISAIGHETDTTLCDLAADRRAATPTAAAEIAVGSVIDICQSLKERETALSAAAHDILSEKERETAIKRLQISAFNPSFILELNEQRLYNIKDRLHSAFGRVFEERQKMCANRAQHLELVNPLRVLSRGYSVTRNGDFVITSAKSASAGDMIETQFSDGKIISVVTEVAENDI